MNFLKTNLVHFVLQNRIKNFATNKNIPFFVDKKFQINYNGENESLNKLRFGGRMKLKYYGTAAYEAVPCVFCSCDICEKTRKLGGKNIRTRSQGCIDGKILLDLSPDTYIHAINGGLEMREIDTILITHAHPDHFYWEILKELVPGFAQRKETFPIYVYAGEAAYVKLLEICEQVNSKGEVIVPKLVKPYDEFSVGDYKITAIPASHAAKTSPLNYVMEKDGKAILYAHDTGRYPEEVFEFMKNKGFKLSIVSLDCTMALREKDVAHHMNFVSNVWTKEKLISIGCADEKTTFVLNHFSHNCYATYDEMCEVAEKEGFVVSYDGIEIEI